MEHVSGDLIWKFLNGEELPDEQIDLVAWHTAECDLCAERLANMAELGEYMPEILHVESPSASLVDRIMLEVEQVEREKAATAGPGAMVPMIRKAWAKRLELFTRLATAAVVTGFMVLGTAGQSYAEQVPVVGKTIAAVSNSGSWFADGTTRVYSELHYLLSVASFDLWK
ncbi:hypothetical protein EV586_105242 [Tumebacillus sp. BK434]|uniref:hypothetical protein n=1 Tax=Tumebacillus sp. BK434 TaxID=2512169 RepID=UPI00104ABEDE|nr:hypothetical protein [Tumebacillus sp. BK434]TCP53896.1 hypothetical protein EV586_105242 [Tumebacillus sp. BK434]